MEARLRLGALDFMRSLQDTLVLAPELEQLGYERLWITHHRGPDTHSSPTMIAALVAGLTERIRVGTAGVLLRHYSPLQVADDFRALGYVFENRIDAGFCAGAVDPRSASVLSPDPGDAYGERVRDLVRYVACRDPAPADPPPVLAGSVPPDLWYMGSSTQGAILAAELGLRFSYCLHLAHSRDSTEAVDAYRRAFREHHGRAAPDVCLSVSGACRQQANEAREVASACPNTYAKALIIGSPKECVERLLDLGSRYEVRDFVMADMSDSLDGCLMSYRLMASELRRQI